jgi:exopolyphosphatase/guanosine-5'-triphosphate,3'-diphosphate pyrophosphatase
MFFKKNPDIVAAVDLGSNSFHMTVAKIQNGQLHILDVIKEMVRLGSGITPEHDIEPQAAEKALACLERFGQRLSALHPGNVRAVGTNALRRAHNATSFLESAEKALGYPIEVVSGREEARLIYTGVNYCETDQDQQTLVADIGGGSTEIIIGRQFSPLLLESLHMGCIGFSMKFFEDGKITAKRMSTAILAARQELEPVETIYRRLGWTRALGSSGSIRAIAEAIQAMGWNEEPGITAKPLQKLRSYMVETGQINTLRLPTLTEERAAVFPGAVAILSAIFEALQIETMLPCQGALREGVLCELIGAGNTNDVYALTIKNLGERYQIDLKHATRINTTALELFEKVKDGWNLDTPGNKNLLSWAAQLHEIGLAISHSRYQRHGGYLIENSDLPGFTRQQQTDVAALIRMHRRKPRKEYLETADKKRHAVLQQLAVLLRLSALLHRSRDDRKLPTIDITANGNVIQLAFPTDWLAQHPLTEADLQQEAAYLKAIGIELKSE